MKVYIASRLRNRSRCKEYRTALEEAGHTCTSRWLDNIGGSFAEVAERDLEDVRRADALILVGHAGRNAGCIFETGVAYERGLRIIHVAAERGECVFLHAEGVIHVYRFTDALALLTVKKEKAA